MSWRGPAAARHGYPVTGGELENMRSRGRDRDRVAGMLGTAYSEGRLAKDEYDVRLEAALSARTYADLDRLMNDLPAGQTTPGESSRQDQRARDCKPRLWAGAVPGRTAGDHPGDRARLRGRTRSGAPGSRGLAWHSRV